MKKSAYISILLLAAMLLNWIPVPVSAEEVETEPAVTETIAVSSLPEDPGAALQSDLAFGSVCILSGCRTLDGQVPLGGSDRKVNTAQGVMIYERNTGTVIYSYNPDMKLSPGSLAKLVTALIVIERLENLDEVVTVPAGIASRIPGGAQSIKLKSEERLTINDLLHCMIMQNAADAAAALAEIIAGNQKAFVMLMNERMKQLGCTSTEFGNVHGFDNVSHYTTARDMARFLLEATKNEKFAQLIADQSYTVPANDVNPEERKFASQNYLMETTIVPKYNDRRVTGGMASYSDTSGASVVCTADNSNPEKGKKGLNIVCVLLGATREFRENGWSVINYGNFDEMIDLLEYVYNNFKVCRVLYDGQALEQYPVANGESDVVGQPHVNMDSVLPADAQMTNLIRNRHVNNGGLTAPIAKDERIGTIEIWYRSSCLMEAELFAAADVRTLDDTGLTIQNGLSKKNSNSSGFSKYVLITCGVILVPAVSYLAINAILRNRVRAQRRRRRHGRRRSY